MRRLLLLLLLWLPVVCFGQDESVTDTVVVTDDYDDDAPIVAPAVPMEDEYDSPIQTSTPFSTIGQQQPVDIKKFPPQTVEKLKADEDYWYADLAPKEKPKADKPLPQISTGFLKPLLWIVLIGGLIAGIVWFLMHNDVRLFGKVSKKITADEEPEEELTDDIFAINYDKEIRKAEEGRNYRLAVRLHYLRTLRALADRGLIDYRFGKTNSDYVMGLYGGEHYKTFFGLTRTFDYTWYGQFPLSPEAYTAVAADFTAFKNSLGA